MDNSSRMQVSERLKVEWLEMTPSGRSRLCANLSQFTSTLSFMERTQELTAGHLTGP